MRRSGQDNLPLLDAGVGERLVFFEYCISLIFVSLRRTSVVVRLRSAQRGWLVGLPYTMLSLLCGWWCIPWGFIYTPLCLWTNLSGGRPIAAEELARYGDCATGKG